MSEPSSGLALAWRIAATEAGLCGSSKIECPHLLMGLLSLDKANPNALKGLGFDAAQMTRVDIERDAIRSLLEGVSTSPAELRRRLRTRIKGKAPKARGMMSRSNASKAAFLRAEALAGPMQVNALHLLSVLFTDPDLVIADLLAEKPMGPDIAAKAAAVAVVVDKTMAVSADSAKTRAVSLSSPPSTPAASPAPVRASSGSGSGSGSGPSGSGSAGSGSSGRSASSSSSRPSSMPPSAPARGRTGPVKTPRHQSLLSVFGRDLTALAKTGSIGPIVGRRKEIASAVETLGQLARFNPLLVGEAGVGKAAIAEALAIRGLAGKDAAVLGGRRIIELDVPAFLTGTEYRGELEKRTKLLLDELTAASDIILFVDGVHRLFGAGRVGQDASNVLKSALVRGDLKVIGAVTIKDFRERIEKDSALDSRFERIDVPEPSITEALEIIHALKPRIEKDHHVQIPAPSIEAAVSLSVRFDPDQRLPQKAVDLVLRAVATVRKTLGKAATGAVTPLIEPRAIAEALAEKRGLPIELVTDGTGEAGRLIRLEGHLRSKVIGQDEAVAKIAARIKLAHSGLSERRGPIASFLVLGPRGVGQTETARTLAKFLSGSTDALVRFNMVDFGTSASVARLMGSVDGTPGELVEGIRRNPHAVLLFDHIEKAHTKVSDLLLQLFDTGQLIDTQGQPADGRNVIVIMTSHLSEKDAIQSAFAAGETLPLTKGGARTKASLRKLFRQEILNRVDEIVTYRLLDESDVRRIARPLLAQVVNRVRKTHGILLRFEPDAEMFIVTSGFNSETGVAELQPTIERLIEIPLAKLGVSGKLSQHPVWKAAVEKGVMSLTPERS